MNTTNHTSPSGEDDANVATPAAYDAWLRQERSRRTDFTSLADSWARSAWNACAALFAANGAIGEREAKVPVPTDVLEARAQGRAEALAIILGIDAETGLDDCTYEYSIGATGEYATGWKEDALRELLRADDSAWSLMQEAESEYWHNLGLREEAERNYARSIALTTEKVAQAEPVAYWWNDIGTDRNIHKAIAFFPPPYIATSLLNPLYAAPPAQTEVALTDVSAKMIADLEAEKTYLGSSRDACSEYDKPRWDRLQAVIERLSGGA
ncbi:MAG TPA: hypothetical protein VGU01_03045 [Sphingomicrobium sp.]|nr:hypothetical protein [Sphingomicrobium sp.]